MEGKSRGVATKALVALCCIPVIPDNVTVSQRAQHPDLKLNQPISLSPTSNWPTAGRGGMISNLVILSSALDIVHVEYNVVCFRKKVNEAQRYAIIVQKYISLSLIREFTQLFLSGLRRTL